MKNLTIFPSSIGNSTITSSPSVRPMNSFWKNAGLVFSMTLWSLLIVISNTIIIYVYIKNKSLQMPKYYFIFSLAIPDFFTGLINVNVFTVHLVYIHWPLGVVPCAIWLVLDFWMYTVSFLMVFIISIDRFIAVYFPVFHRFSPFFTVFI